MMGTLFKAEDQSAQRNVRAFSQAKRPEWPISDTLPMTKIDEFREEQVEYEAGPETGNSVAASELIELQSLLESTSRQHEEAEKQAYQRGVEDGKMQVASLEQERLELLKSVAQDAQVKLDENLAGLQALSLQLAQIALSRILGNGELYADLVAHSIRYRCAQLSSELVTEIRVSPADFPNQEALGALRRGVNRTDIEVDTRLASGDCVIDLKLGRCNIGVGAQWGGLQAFLADLSQEVLPA